MGHGKSLTTVTGPLTSNKCQRARILLPSQLALPWDRGQKRGQAPFAGTARRVLRTNGACPPFVRPLKETVVMSSQPRRRRLEVEDIGDVSVVNFTDRKILDEQNIQAIGEQLCS